MPTNWGLAYGPNGFQNALATGLQFGQMARQRQDQREYKNALANYDPSNPETVKPIMAADPRLGLQLQAQQGQVAAQQQERRKADLPVLSRLLDHAKDPASYQQSLQLAQQYGIDVSQAPPQYDPNWIAQQKMLVEAVQTPEGQQALSTAGKQAVDMGYQPGTPEFQAKVTEIWQQNGAIPYTDASGATRLYIPGQQQGGPQPGSVVGGFRFKGGNPNDQASWEPVNGGPTQPASGGFPGS